MRMRDQLKEAVVLAQKVRGLSARLRFDARDYDEKWPIKYADELADMADEFLKFKYKK